MKRDFLHSWQKRLFLVVDATVENLYQFSREGHYTLVIPGGERSKTRGVKEFVENQLLESGVGPEDLLIAIGGGTITDLVGFVAATLYRGISYINVPTTLLGMVDASIGGKTGINTSFGKNTIGAFHLPRHVHIEPAFLETLPEQEYLMGLAEVIKYGLIFDADLFELLERKNFSLKKVIQTCCAIKQHVVDNDPLEKKGLRQILNFGHTVGHGLELMTNYEIPHGFAVAMGLLLETKISALMGYCNEVERVERILASYKFPLQSFSKEVLYSAMLRDKKSRSDQVYCVLLDRIGQCVEKGGAYSFPVPKEIWNIA